MNRDWLKIFFFLVLACITAGTALFLKRYQDKGPELLANNAFGDALQGWQVSGNQDGVQLLAGGVLRLTGLGAGQSMELSQSLAAPPPGTLLRFRGDLHIEKIVNGKKSWHTDCLILASFDQDGSGLPVSNVLASRDGSGDWRKYSRVFLVPAGAATLKVAVQLHQAEGILYVRDISLHCVGEAGWYPWLKGGVLALWMLFLSLLFVPSYFPDRRMVTRRSGVLFAILFFLIIVGITIPGTFKRHLGDEIMKDVIVVADIVGTSQGAQTGGGEKLVTTISSHLPSQYRMAHFGLFAALAALTLIVCSSKSWVALVGDLLLLAGATELMQFYVEGRSPLWSDLAADLYGGATGILLGIGFHFLWRRRL